MGNHDAVVENGMYNNVNQERKYLRAAIEHYMMEYLSHFRQRIFHHPELNWYT